MEDSTWRQAWDLKVFGYINLVREFYPMLKQRKGVVENVIGTSGERAEPNYIAGSSGNAALMAFTRGLGSHSPRDRVRVVGVHPGAVSTERIERLCEREPNGCSTTSRAGRNDTARCRLAEPQLLKNLQMLLCSLRLRGRPTRAEPSLPSTIQPGLLCNKSQAPA